MIYLKKIKMIVVNDKINGLITSGLKPFADYPRRGDLEKEFKITSIVYAMGMLPSSGQKHFFCA
jgi:hypothetical protein